MCKYTTIYTIVDDFCKLLDKRNRFLLIEDNGKQTRCRETLLSLSEMLSIVIFYHFSGYKYFKYYYENEICGRLSHLFPKRPSYDRFIALMPRLFFPLVMMFHFLKGKKTGEYFVDSTHFAVCKNKRINRHRTFEGLAMRGKSTMGWFFGFKLHLVCNTDGELVAVKITAGNEDDRRAFEEIVEKNSLTGKCFADKGYIGKDLFKRLWNKGLHIITGIKKNMQNYLMPWLDRIMLKKRVMIETVFSILKEEFNIRPNKHRSPINFLVSIFSALLAYQIKFKNAQRAYP